MAFLCTYEFWVGMMQNWHNSWILNPWLSGLAAAVLLTILPIFVVCVLLNRYVFKSADMINGAING